MATLKDLASKQKSKIFSLVIIAVLSGLSIILQAYLFVVIVDLIFLKQEPFSEVLSLLIGLLGVMFARTLFQYTSGRIGIKMASKVKNDVRKALLHKFSNNPILASTKGQSGQKVSVMMDAVDEIDSYFSSYIPQVIQASIIPLMILIYIFTQHWMTAVIIVITAPFIPIFMMIIGFQTKDKAEQQLDKMAAFSGKFLDTLQGLTTLKLYGRSNEKKKEIEKSSLDFRDATMEVLKIAFSNSLALEFISMLSIGLIALEVAIRLIIFQDISFFIGFLMLVLAPEFYTKLKDLGSAFHTGRSSMGAAKKIQHELAEEQQAVTWGNERLPTDQPPKISLKNAGFYYGEATFSLKQIDVEINPYEQVAIVGRTGSGKTTLLHLIAGLLPLAEGEIEVNGRPLSSYRENDWYDRLSYISQDPYLFSGTIAENIAIGTQMNATRQEIEDAARQAGISDLFESLENGYDTPIGEAGRGLSGGEKQRTAIARAFLKKPSIILFDEPTTGLDLETERILQASIKKLAKHSTIITVAHRLHTIQHADKILFMENGQVLAVGTHEELLQTVTSYRQMVEEQQGGALH
ncbi:thiol reductant ABC exporter subunit CydD [Oceanobacillus piezotolerans]|uniref:Thiol reductant ABC exporter subunit CydD n=1 Tax=Oceanobacillus piezotolerans TaxID=2448030 RepID=A0A498DEI3_9BACI|nr:thiol reductant ABC exporter subunit CydD [Oceanobacillus piezotolerans]RLL47070.1 thiol reductant ABC exporter subunit CydD [Oceanobacillus piezotolerans]